MLLWAANEAFLTVSPSLQRSSLGAALALLPQVSGVSRFKEKKGLQMGAGSDNKDVNDKVALAILEHRMKAIEDALPKLASKADMDLLKGIVFKGAGTVLIIIITALLSGKFLR